MRRHRSGLVTVNAISGTHVVFLGFNMKQKDTNGLLGFAIKRRDGEEVRWLRSAKTFASVRKGTAYDDVSSEEHPFQAFQWADYTALPGKHYTYTVIPMYGKPGALKPRASTVVPISTEQAEGKTHSVYFNRAVIASQAYAKRFGPNPPDKVGPYAYAWLTRDLLPGLLAFIARAKNKDYSLRAAIYECHQDDVLNALHDAKKRGAGIKIIYGGNPKDSTTKENKKAIAKAGIGSLCTPRKNAKIMHNKFIVLLHKGKPVAVWTGSTNWSPSALFGQMNVGHVVEDRNVAKAFLDYWAAIESDPERPEIVDWLTTENVAPPEHNNADLVEIFSPHKGAAVFDWYTQVADGAAKGLFMTFPFGIVKDFRPVFDQDDLVLRYALLEQYVNGGTKASRAAAIKDILRIRKLPNVGMSVGSRIFVKSIDGWHMEAKALGTHVHYVHSKFMLVDPLGSHPVTISGSANWSLASTNANDENMIVIRGDKRVAHIYFTEFMRIFTHYRFRESVERHVSQGGKIENWRPRDLAETSAGWVPPHYTKGGEREIRRVYFSGTA